MNLWECPNCHKGKVYVSFGVYDKWKVHCEECGTTTKSHKTREDAESEWNKMLGAKMEVKDDNN